MRVQSLLASVPPLIQVLFLVALGSYVVISVAARIHPALGAHVWDPERQPGSREHFYQYTMVPALVFVAAIAVVVTGWDESRPWLGGWSRSKTFGVIGLASYAFAAVIGGTIAGKKIDLSDARKLSAWLPLLLILSGVGALAGAVLLLGSS